MCATLRLSFLSSSPFTPPHLFTSNKHAQQKTNRLQTQPNTGMACNTEWMSMMACMTRYKSADFNIKECKSDVEMFRDCQRYGLSQKPKKMRQQQNNAVIFQMLRLTKQIKR
jgi:hypothetical protein